MIIAYVPLAVLLIGVIVYFIAAAPKVAEIGRLMFAIGLLVFLWHLAGQVFRLGHP